MQLFLLNRYDNFKQYLLIIVLDLLFQTVQTDQCNSNRISEHCYANLEEPKVDKMSESVTGNSLAVVLYREEDVLPLHRGQRKFNYCNHGIEIKQDWSGLGVAAVVWDAAEVLAKYLELNPEIVRGKSIIELGAGTGLVGMVTALLGAKTTITDRNEVIDYLTQTVETNLPTETLKDTIVAPLDWTKNLDNFKQSYDVILGADIVYIEEVFDDFLKTLTVLSNADNFILLSCRIRYDRDTNFLSRLEETFTVTKVLYDKEKDVNLYKVILKR